jgi:hypothetical protein
MQLILQRVFREPASAQHQPSLTEDIGGIEKWIRIEQDKIGDLTSRNRSRVAV